MLEWLLSQKKITITPSLCILHFRGAELVVTKFHETARILVEMSAVISPAKTFPAFY